MKQLIRHILREHTREIGETRKITTPEFIEKAKEVHGDKYDYSKVDYKGNKEKVIINCPIHGDFLQAPQSHIGQKAGCPKCNGREEWTEDKIRNAALKYDARLKFFKGNPRAYDAAKRKGEDFFNDVTSHMIIPHSGRKPPKWTDKKIKKEILKYTSLVDLRNSEPGLYSALLRKNEEEFNELTKGLQKKRGKYSDEELENIAKQYTSASEFQKGNSGALAVAREKGEDFFKKITKHFVKKVREPYTFDEIKQIASKYNHIGEFQKKDSSAYIVARNKGWIDDVSKHMTPLLNYWDYDNVERIAKKYKTKKEFMNDYGGAYNWALSHLTEDEFKKIFSHFNKIGNMHKRMIYVFEFPDKSVYVGLTFNPDKRFNEHMNQINSAVRKYVELTGLQPTFKKVTDYMTQEDAVNSEEAVEKKYRNEGWKILNVKKTGALGSIIAKWNFDTVKDEALKYKTRGEFSKKSPSAYGAAKKNGWYEKVTEHMPKSKTQKRDFEDIRNVALKYKSPEEFREKDYGAYQAARKNGWYEEVTKHMKRYGKK
jgi:predicted GIY-YIG superfamily endonuclease